MTKYAIFLVECVLLGSIVVIDSQSDGCDNSSLGALKCRPDSTTDVECNGRGNCVCGQCHCNPRENPEEIIDGQFCECDNFSCDRHNGILCSGPEHGICECGSCKCHVNWEGQACECSTSIDSCRAPNGEICSGHGVCKCGRCECSIEEDVRFYGKYCENCPTCPNRCEELNYCVQCLVWKKGPLKNPKDCARSCNLFTPVVMEYVEYDEEKDEHLCAFYDEDDCLYKFEYDETVERNGTVTLHVRAEENLRCPSRGVLSSFFKKLFKF